MATGQVNRVVHHLRRLAQHQGGIVVTDGQLLEAFVVRRDERAFEELVRRHGPMVLGVCRRVLGDAHDADDAFQATFLVLVRKAGSVRPRDLVGNWLYGVACRTALEARGRAARRRAREKQVADMPHPSVEPAELWRDVQPVLDRELAALPEKYRTALVLCELEGRSRKDAARHLNVPEGTLSSRLAMGRKLLARRLARHGLAVTGTLLASALAEQAARASVPARLFAVTVKAAALGAAGPAVAQGLITANAAALTEGVVQAMFVSKLKSFAAVVLTFGLLATGLGVVAGAGEEDPPGPAKKAIRAQAAPKADVLKPKPTPVRPAEVEDFLFFFQDVTEPAKRRVVREMVFDVSPSDRAFWSATRWAEAWKNPKLSDAEFLRRVFLDVRGTPPTAVEMRYFLADKDGRKREKLVQLLLADERAARLESYVKDKLGKKELSADERRVLEKVQEFLAQEGPHHAGQAAAPAFFDIYNREPLRNDLRHPESGPPGKN